MNITTELKIPSSIGAETLDSLEELLAKTAPGDFLSGGLPPVIILERADPRVYELVSSYVKSSKNPQQTVFVHPLMEQILALSETDGRNYNSIQNIMG